MTKRRSVGHALCVGLALSLVASRPHAARAAATLGANKFDLLLQFTGRASGGDGSAPYRRVTRAMGIKAVRDARDAGFRFVRIAAAGYGPNWPSDQEHNDLARWLSDPTAYWADVAAMFDTLDQAQMRLVPSFLWNSRQFPALTGETLADLINNPKSKSRSLAQRYIADFITRYKSRPTILFYELGNELNLAADLDLVSGCATKYAANHPDFCASTGNYTTQAMIAFCHDIASFIRRQDPTRGLSSGFSAPRIDAAHLAARPQFAPGGPDWRPDTRNQLIEYLRRTNTDFDIVSLHIYPGSENLRPAAGLAKEIDLADLAASVVHSLGKKLYLGEFGSQTGSALVGDVAAAMKRGALDYASVWVWEMYQFSPNQPADPTGKDYRIEPGYNDQLLAPLRAYMSPPATPPEPRVVLAWPLPCADLRQPTNVTAVASIGAAAPRRVTFLADGKPIGTADKVPFQMTFDPGTQAARVTSLEAHIDGTTASFVSSIALGNTAQACDAGAMTNRSSNKVIQ